MLPSFLVLMVVLLVAAPLAAVAVVLVVLGIFAWRRYQAIEDLSYTEVRENDPLCRSLDYCRRYFDRNRPSQ